MQVWFWILGWLLSILTITGNGFIFFLICSKRQLRTKTNALIVSIAVADFCVGMSAVPPLFMCEMAGSCNHLGTMVITWTTKSLFQYASVTNLCCLVLDRYIAVVKPLKYLTFMKRRRVIQMVTLSWVIPIVLIFLYIHRIEYFPFPKIDSPHKDYNCYVHQSRDVSKYVIDMFLCSYVKSRI